MQFKTIGFIGVGTMGKGMVQNLAKNNFQVLAYNRTKEKILDLASDKIEIVNSPEEAADADVIITCLPSDNALSSVIFETKLLDRLKDRYLVDCGTTSVELTQKIADICEKNDVEFMDAPITGSKLGAQAGTMTMMMGGKREAFDRLLPIFEAMGKVHVYCGPITHGQRAKLALNMAQAMILESYLECLVFALKNGVPLEAMQQIMENSGARSNVGVGKLPRIKKRDFEQHFMLKLMHKDMTFADNEMKRLGLDLPLAKHIKEVFDHSLHKHGEEDMSAIVKRLERQAGVELKEK